MSDVKAVEYVQMIQAMLCSWFLYMCLRCGGRRAGLNSVSQCEHCQSLRLVLNFMSVCKVRCVVVVMEIGLVIKKMQPRSSDGRVRFARRTHRGPFSRECGAEPKRAFHAVWTKHKLRSTEFCVERPKGPRSANRTRPTMKHRALQTKMCEAAVRGLVLG